jgi:hypothetical protein
MFFLVMQRVLSVGPCWCRHLVSTRAACLLLPHPYSEHFADTDSRWEDKFEPHQGGCNTISSRSHPLQSPDRVCTKERIRRWRCPKFHIFTELAETTESMQLSLPLNLLSAPKISSIWPDRVDVSGCRLPVRWVYTNEFLELKGYGLIARSAKTK